MNETKTGRCLTVCLILGLIAAAIAWIFARSVLDTLPLLVMAFFVFVTISWALYELFCGKTEAVAHDEAAPMSLVSDTKPAAAASAVSMADEKKDEAPASAPAKPSSAATQKSAKSSSGSKTKAASKSATKSTTAKKPAAKSSTSAKSGPERLKKPKGKADDLKMISGVGPKLEKTLNGLGFWHFEQIAKWKKADVAVVDDELKFKGRIERDDWIKQAKALAKGGEEEYIKVFGKKPR